MSHAAPVLPLNQTVDLSRRTIAADMTAPATIYATQLRQELAERNRAWAKVRPHVESYGSNPVIVYEPDNGRHGNFYDPAYAAIMAHPDWLRRFDKIHAQGRSLPRPLFDHTRRWRELDSCMSSDALIMNILCTPGVADSPTVRGLLGIESPGAQPAFGFRARVPLANGRFDRTEVDLCWGGLLAEAKLTESDFQVAKPEVLHAYRDFAAVFDADLLPTVEIPVARRRISAEFPEDYTQEEVRVAPEDWQPTHLDKPRATTPGFAGYQLIRNVLAAHALGLSFCVLHDERRPDLRESWFSVLAAVRSAELRVRLKVLTWQELAEALPSDLQAFLDVKYGIVPPGYTPFPLASAPNSETIWH